jgi:hypothetical protein
MRIFYAAVREAGDAAATATMPPGPDLHFLADMQRAGPLLAEAGFTGLRQAEVPSAWMLEAPEHLFEAFAHASVRSAMLLARQPPDRLQAIRTAMVREVLTLVGPAGPWQVPMPALVIGATAA